MLNSEFIFHNTPFLAALTGYMNDDDRKEAALNEVLNGYDNVSKEQVLKHMSEFNSREEMEHYVHNLAIRSKEINKWE